MILNKNITLGLIALITIANAGTEEDIFRSGIERTFNVMQYQKRISTDSKRPLSNNFCYELHPKSGENKIDPHDIVKLEALSLLLHEKPLYYRNNKNQDIFCFTTAKNEEAFKTKVKYCNSKFEKMPLYSPTSTKVEKGYRPLLPSLGVWKKDMTPSINLLNERLVDLESEKKSLENKLQEIKTMMKETLSNLSSVKFKHKKKKIQNKPRVYIDESPISEVEPKVEKVEIEKKKTSTKQNDSVNVF